MSDTQTPHGPQPIEVARMVTRLTQFIVGGCSCGTKTPELQFHDEACGYRVASEAGDMLYAIGRQYMRAAAERDALRDVLRRTTNRLASVLRLEGGGNPDLDTTVAEARTALSSEGASNG